MLASPSAADPSPPPSLVERLRHLALDIKLSHSIFALPWAILATFLAAGGYPRIGQVVLIVLCMVSARTVAMSANRVLDASIDARNPRPARRAIPAGRLSRGFVSFVAILCALVFIATTSLFGVLYDNWLPLICSVPVLLFISAYPLLKRSTRLVHYYLGAALGIAPICAWIAIAGTVGWPAVVMGAAVLLWTAGFDILYACQDYEIDVRDGLYSVPAKLGIAGALRVARLTHGVCIVLLIVLAGIVEPFGMIFGTAVGIAGTLLAVEHWLARPNDLSKITLAFFTLNGIIALVIGGLGMIDLYV
ncbi:MAG TPA: UbiA-like polyprenyltransferase [Tepidisphaeraceae bacterium]|nr:UbiA-like polyprenyltransferase [Tepidisphaeraceae bacterium]